MTTPKSKAEVDEIIQDAMDVAAAFRLERDREMYPNRWANFHHIYHPTTGGPSDGTPEPSADGAAAGGKKKGIVNGIAEARIVL